MTKKIMITTVASVLLMQLTLTIKVNSQPLTDQTKNLMTDKMPENCPMNDGEIKWIESLKDAKEIALKENKNIFICFCADWCESCHEMDKTTYKDEKVINKLKTDFITVKLNISKSKEAEIIRKEYGVNQFPTIIFLNRDGKFMEKYSLFGFLNAKDFLMAINIVPNN